MAIVIGKKFSRYRLYVIMALIFLLIAASCIIVLAYSVPFQIPVEYGEPVPISP